MKVRFRALAFSLVALLAVAVFGGKLLADNAIPCERRLPRDVVAYVSFRNIAELKTQWSQTLTGQLLQDEALADFRSAAETHLAELSEKITSHVGLGLKDMLEIPHGELAAAMAIQSDGKPAVVLILDFGDKADAVNKLIEKLGEDAKEHDLERSEEEFEETRFVIYRQKGADESKPPQDAVAYFIKETQLVVGNGAGALKGVLNRWDGKHDQTFAENPVFRYVADKTAGESPETAPLVTWYIDPLGLTKGALAASPNTPPQAGMVLTMLPLLGVDKFKGLGGSFDMARGEFDMVSRTLIYFEPPVRGLLNMFQFDAEAQSPPKWVSDEATSYFALNWNIAKAYRAAESLVNSFQGEGAMARFVQQLADNEQSGGVHLKKDLIDQLTGKVHVIGEASDTDDDDDEDKFLVAAEVSNVAAAKATLRKLAQIPSFPVKEREFQGEILYEFSSPGGDDELPAGFAIAENHLLFGTDVKLVERVLRGTAGRESLADTSAYKRIAKRFPEKTASIGYGRDENAIQSLLEFLNSPAAVQVLGPDAMELEEKLPSSEVLKKFMASSGSFMQLDERGLKITSFSLKKEAE